MSSKKLQNIKAIRQLLDGTHKWQTRKTIDFNVSDRLKNSQKKREIGEVWEEVDPITGHVTVWEQHNGFRSKQSKMGKILDESLRDVSATMFKNCLNETCSAKNKPLNQLSRLDKKMSAVYGMCFNCAIEKEHEMKIAGTWEDYQIDKMIEYAKDWISRAEKDIEFVKSSYEQTLKFVHENGTFEEYKNNMTPEQFAEKVDTDFNKLKDKILAEIEELRNVKGNTQRT